MASTKNKMNGTKLIARTAKTLIGYTVNHEGIDHTITDVMHMGAGGWMLRLSNGALLRPSEIR